MSYVWASFAIPFEVYMECPVDITFEINPGERVRVRLRPPAPGDVPLSIVDEENSTWMPMKQEDIVAREHFTHAEVWFAPSWSTDPLSEDGPDAEAVADLKAILRKGPEYALSIVNHLLGLAVHASKQFQIRPLSRDDVRDWVTGEADELGREPDQTGMMITAPRSQRPRVHRTLNHVLPEIERALDEYHALPVWRKVLTNAERLAELGEYDSAMLMSHVALELRLNEVLRRLQPDHESTLGRIVTAFSKRGIPKPEQDVKALEKLRGPVAHGAHGREGATWAQVREHLDTALRVGDYYEAAVGAG